MFITVFEKMHVKCHYNMVQKWYSSPYALSDQYYSYAVVFVLLWATFGGKHFLYARIDLEIWVLVVPPISLLHTAAYTF